MADFTNEKQENREQQGSTGGQTPSVVEKFVIRLPQGLRNKIKNLSEQSRRSMNSEIIMVLENHIQQNLMDDSVEAVSGETLQQYTEHKDSERVADEELTRRLENLPEDKKKALLELLG